VCGERSSLVIDKVEDDAPTASDHQAVGLDSPTDRAGDKAARTSPEDVAERSSLVPLLDALPTCPSV
jgi:hypothetical protein